MFSVFLHIFVINYTLLKKLFDFIFKESTPIPDIHGIKNVDVLTNVSGDAGIFIWFLIIGGLCIFALANSMPREAYKQRTAITRLLGLAIMFSAISRGLNVLAMWHNYYMLNGIVKNLSSIFGLLSITYLPFLIKAIKNSRQLEDVKETMEETSKKVDELKDISKKVINRE